MSGGEILLVFAAISAGALLKSITGMGLPIVAIPIISLALGVDDAVAVIAVPNLLSNVAMSWRERDAYPETRDLPVLAGFGVVAAVLGTLFLVSVSEKPVVALLGVVVGAYAVVKVLSPDRSIGPASSRRWAPVVGTVAGFLQGAIGISGPVVATWIHAYRLDRRPMILSMTLLFMVTGATQAIVFAVSGNFADVWLAALLACIPVLALLPVGERLRGRLSSEGFDRAILATLVVATGSLVIRTFA